MGGCKVAVKGVGGEAANERRIIICGERGRNVGLSLVKEVCTLLSSRERVQQLA